ncbi:hypothetical protein A0J61_03640 [Choanephora cucurbitarum]|uniref:CCHC-type domain-containing protein n=1 Tax=Choanephora cucurbitarum TaxID=101091 RepID=A0A1C7NHR9_9FUNG|nr:hypothetical protein A0J61_03640 [Choanephora cucurbitarum]
METPIEVLRIEQNGVSKELARFRACDPETRSLYCREWAQFIYKKHFVWNAKTQEEVPESQTTPNSLNAGKYQINFLLDDTTSDLTPARKERAALMAQKFEKLQEQQQQENDSSLIDQVIQACQSWMTLPSGYSGLPDLFEPVEFNPYPDHIPLVEDPKDPSHLLDPLIIERQALCLPSDCFHLLKNLTGDILLSHTTPTCNHTRPESKTPNDLEVDRAIFNEKAETAIRKALSELTLALEQAWHPLNGFLERLGEFEKRRTRLMGKGCQATVDAYFASQQFVSFTDSWPKQQTQFKNKKSTPEEIAKVDQLFEDHLEHLKKLVRDFVDQFAPAHLKEIHNLTTDLWKLIVPTIYEMGERMASHEDHKGSKNSNAAKIGESLKALDINSLKKMDSTKEVDDAQSRIIDTLQSKVDDYFKEIDGLLKAYKEGGRSSLSGRIDKLNHKDMKKKIKKVESGYYSIRQTFRYEVTENIFPESLFCKFSLVCLEPLMQEGEVMEAVTIEKEVKRFIESHKDLLHFRCSLLNDFEDGVQTGRRELAGVLGKLFLKEGMRIQGDNLALKRQNNLLKSMGVATEEAGLKKKKTKKKSSPSVSGTSTPIDQEITSTVSKQLPSPKDKANGNVSPVSATKSSVKATTSVSKKTAGETKETKPVLATTVEKNASAEKKTVVAASPVEKKQPNPVSNEKKTAVTPAVAEKKTTAPVVAEKKVVTPVVPEKKVAPPAVVEQKQTVPVSEKKPVPTSPAEIQKKSPAKASEIKSTEEKKVVAPPPGLNKKSVAPLPVAEKKAAPPPGMEKKVTAPPGMEKQATPPPGMEKKAAPPPPGMEKKSMALPPGMEKKPSPAPPGLENKSFDKGTSKKIRSAYLTKRDKKKQKSNDRLTDKSLSLSLFTIVIVEANTVTDWTTLQASVSAEANITSNAEPVKEPENAAVQDWDALRAEVQQQTVAKPVETNNWSTPNTAANAWTADAAPTPKESSIVEKKEDTSLGGWGAPLNAELSGPAPVTNGWNSTVSNGWGKSTSTGGWGSSEPKGNKDTEKKPTKTNNGAWKEPKAEAASNGWIDNTPVDNSTPVAVSTDSWNETSTSQPSDDTWNQTAFKQSSDDWNASTSNASDNSWNKQRADHSDDWRSKSNNTNNDWDKKPATNASNNNWNTDTVKGWNSSNNRNSGWNGERKKPNRNQLSNNWENKKSDTWSNTKNTVSNNTGSQQDPSWEGAKLPWGNEPITDTSVPVPTPAPTTSVPLKPPMPPPGLAASSSHVEEFPVAAPTFKPLSTGNLQEPLPSNINQMNADMLLLIVKHLHHENGTLIHSVYSMQQEMAMMTKRYSEIMALAREREAQTLALYESRKQTEMEEARRYVLQLEARLKQYESGGHLATTAGFGNQDLFAGYREEMSSNNNNNNGNQHKRKMWSKNSVVRCGNCAEYGHESADCKVR